MMYRNSGKMYHKEVSAIHKASHSHAVSSKRAMKMSAVILAFFLTAPLWHGGCSREESSQYPGEHYQMVLPIKEAPQAKAEPNSFGGEGELKTQGARQTEAAPTATAIERAGKQPSSETGGMQAEAREISQGSYVVKTGEGLSEIAARDEVYGDPLKWPILYFYNMKKIGELQLVEGFLDRGLPEGESLRIITPREVRENLQRRTDRAYAVNVLSARSQKGLISSAIRLMKEGYSVYITQATVEGMRWMRLRVGFFETRIEASLERMKINDLLRVRNSWVTEVGREELEEFGGLIPRFHKVE
jgi:hypothetical protein